MSPEQAHAVAEQIAALKRIGDKLKSDGRLQPQSQYKDKVWLSEVTAFANKYFGDRVALSERVKQIETLEDGLDLLDTLSDYVFIDPFATASDALKALIEHTLLERYFKSWEVRLLAIAFAVVAAAFFGGTIFLGLQVQGVASQADAARRSIESARDQAVNAGDALIRQIQKNAENQANAQIQKLTDAIEKSSTAINGLTQDIAKKRDLLNAQSAQAQETISSAAYQGSSRLDAQIGQIQTNAENQAKAQIQKLSDAIEKSSTAMNSLTQDIAKKRDGLNAQFAQAQETIGSVASQASSRLDAQIGQIKTDAEKQANEKITALQNGLAAVSKSLDELNQEISGRREQARIDIDAATTKAEKDVKDTAKSYFDSKTAQIDNMIAKGVAEKVNDTDLQIRQKLATVDAMKQNFEKELPVAAANVVHQGKDFNDTVDRYSGRIDDIVSRLSVKSKMTPVDAVAGTLGNAFILVLVAVLLSALAILLWIGWFVQALVRKLWRSSARGRTTASQATVGAG